MRLLPAFLFRCSIVPTKRGVQRDTSASLGKVARQDFVDVHDVYADVQDASHTTLGVVLFL